MSYLSIGNVGEYKEAVQYVTDAGLENLTEKPLPCRSLRVVAESFAVLGLALEKLQPQSTSKDCRALKSLETASDITLLYFQEQDKFQGI